MARKKFPDYVMLQSIVNFMLDNIGNISSTNKIANTMTSNGRNLSVHTVENYITALLEVFIFYKATRYDVKGKQYLKTGDSGHILENVVYLELKRRLERKKQP